MDGILDYRHTCNGSECGHVFFNSPSIRVALELKADVETVDYPHDGIPVHRSVYRHARFTVCLWRSEGNNRGATTCSCYASHFCHFQLSIQITAKWSTHFQGKVNTFFSSNCACACVRL